MKLIKNSLLTLLLLSVFALAVYGQAFPVRTSNVFPGVTISSTTGCIIWTGSTQICNVADGVIKITNAAGTGFGLRAQGTSSADIRNVANNGGGTIGINQINLAGSAYTNSTTPSTSAGFGTGEAFGTGARAAAWTLTIGTGGTDSTGTLTLPSASNGWVCNVTDLTNNASFVTSQTGGTTTSATFKNYSRTTGLEVAWTAADLLSGSCVAY